MFIHMYSRCEPWCWNIYLHLPQKWPSFVGVHIPAPWFAPEYIYIYNGREFIPCPFVFHLPNGSQYVDSSSAKDGFWMFSRDSEFWTMAGWCLVERFRKKGAHLRFEMIRSMWFNTMATFLCWIYPTAPNTETENLELFNLGSVYTFESRVFGALGYLEH